MNELNPNPTAVLQKLFGDNRAEWAAHNFGDLFVQPVYHSKLEAVRPCFLVGGRGTGKTTSLQSLHYAAVERGLRSDEKQHSAPNYLGILVRMNKNRVRAFAGSALPVAQWQKLFAHYFNLIVCTELCGLTKWIQNRDRVALSPASLQLLSTELGTRPTSTIDGLQRNISLAVSELQIYINNVNSPQSITLSMAESPVRSFVTTLRDEGLIGDATVFCCVDEFENLLDYQQSVLNTYIKHAEPPLSYKIGVRKNGIRTRQTLDGNDLLKTPDDFAEIEIADEGFDYFAKAVASLRLKSAQGSGIQVPGTLDEFLMELTLEEEADLLGAAKVAAQVRAQLSNEPDHVADFFAKKSNLELSFLRYWHETDGRSISELASDWFHDEVAWKTRIGNYAYASLFALSKGNKGARIRKYYCGERVLLSLAAGNIRYFLELLEAAIGYELREEQNASALLRISPKSQTLAARDVGSARLSQLEGLAEHGVQLKRLVLAIGKVFFELARTSNGRSPEITSFVLSGPEEDIRRISSLLSEGVGHLAFEVETRTKATSTSEMKDEEYRLHRIFSAFFEISHRKKRRMTFPAKELLAVLEDRPARAISALLGSQTETEEDSLPDQLALFAPFYRNYGED